MQSPNEKVAVFDVGESDLGESDLLVYPRCPECGKFIKEGNILVNGLDEVKFTGWVCKTHGEVTPDYEYGETDPELPNDWGMV